MSLAGSILLVLIYVILAGKSSYSRFLASLMRQKMLNLSTLENHFLSSSLDNFTPYKILDYKVLTPLTKLKTYISITSCVLEHILTTIELNSHEKLYYLLADSLACINGKNTTQQRSVALSSSSWAKKLGCSKSEIFTMQKSLEEKGYFVITRDKNKLGKNQRNIIIPTLPDRVFTSLAETPDRFSLKHDASANSSLKSSHDIGSDGNTYATKREYLDKSKLFIRLNYQLLLLIVSDALLSSFAKVVWLDFYVKAYKSYMKRKSQSRAESGNRIDGENIPFSFFSTYKELETLYSCSKSTLSKAIKELGEGGFLHKVHSYVKNDNLDDNLHDKSLWHFTLTVPSDGQDLIFNENISDNIGLEGDNNEALGYTKEVVNEAADQQVISGISKYDPYISRFKPLINKDLKTNIKDLRNLDSDFHFSDNVDFSKSNLSLFYKNSFEEKENSVLRMKEQTFQKTVPSRIVNNKTKTLQDYYPLSKEQVNNLNWNSGKDYSVNFTNQLLLKLHKTGSDKQFLSSNHMMSYMSKAMRAEKHQGPLVNHESFRFACNLSKTEIENGKIEEYLKEIECSIDTDYQSQLRRKIAGQFEPKLAYQILKEGKFAFSQIEKEEGELQIEEKKEETFVIQLPDRLYLTDLQQETLENAVYSVYGNCQILYEETAPRGFSKTVKQEGNGMYEKGRAGAFNATGAEDRGNLTRFQLLTQSQGLSKDLDIEQLDTHSGWYKVSKALRKELGDDVYRNWFSGVVAEERLDLKAISQGEKSLVLHLPSKMMRDMVRQRYGSLIEEYCKQLTSLKFYSYENIVTRDSNLQISGSA